MKPTAMIAAVVALVPGVLGNFWIHYVHKETESLYTHHTNEGAVFVSTPQLTCEHDARGVTVWENNWDVSEWHPGLRIIPNDEVGPPLYRDNLWEVEFNTLDELPDHYILNKKRNFGMYDMWGLKEGDCHLNRSFTYNLNCRTKNARVLLKGSSMFYCESMTEI